MHLYGLAIKPAKKRPPIPVDSVEITVDHGIVGDCRGTSRERQITVIALENWRVACQLIDREELPFYARRASICTVGHQYGPADVGKKIAFAGGVTLEITGETDPCPRMDVVAAGLQDALRPDWRGGVTCNVITGGEITRGEHCALVTG